MKLIRFGEPGREKPGAQLEDGTRIDASAIGFRLAPRINAAGRLCRPDIALELILTEDKERAKELAAELEELNRERQAVEDRIVLENALEKLKEAGSSIHSRKLRSFDEPPFR